MRYVNVWCRKPILDAESIKFANERLPRVCRSEHACAKFHNEKRQKAALD